MGTARQALLLPVMTKNQRRFAIYAKDRREEGLRQIFKQARLLSLMARKLLGLGHHLPHNFLYSAEVDTQ
jgi:hypothetical protein